ncbi:FMN reductase (NADPH) [Melghiribacillus thermohalophilus]|uniref:FMN reductase (NADPH) n=1 Tax=Melghiribacillus thermohalophilus TaxID=1324956 RepID=A0A4R3MWY1_9BACI|nr:oxygen-insensitive NADPH nitroreductase [Melghiribacillus thermohalophilus]TCT20011.1 FMN reductase (NADPH) [Melghiribacillus thermohalophilus]
MNPVIEQMFRHRSIRKFKEQQLSDRQIRTIVEAAQRASTSNYYQAYSIIGVTDPIIKKEIADLSGHEHVERSGHFFVFCADLLRLIERAESVTRAKLKENLENTEHFLVAVIDAALAAQNASLAAESMGLGICYIGGIRNDMKRVDELLKLPEFVIPLFGLAVGYPDHDPGVKPRLPLEAVYFENIYCHDEAVYTRALENFDETLKKYYAERATNRRHDTWSDQIQRKLIRPVRSEVTEYVQSKGMNKI